MKNVKMKNKAKRHVRIRARVKGTAGRPRLVVFRSHIRNYAQLINDEKGITLAAASDVLFKEEGTKIQRAKKVGEHLAQEATKKGIHVCVFDRNGYKYHGRVKALADGAREGGLQF